MRDRNQLLEQGLNSAKNRSYTGRKSDGTPYCTMWRTKRIDLINECIFKEGRGWECDHPIFEHEGVYYVKMSYKRKQEGE